MQKANLTNRNQIVNKAVKELGLVDNQYQQSEVIKNLKAFYVTPLKKAITRLNKIHKDSYQTIATDIFDGEITRQAVYDVYVLKEASK